MKKSVVSDSIESGIKTRSKETPCLFKKKMT